MKFNVRHIIDKGRSVDFVEILIKKNSHVYMHRYLKQLLKRNKSVTLFDKEKQGEW